MDETDLADVAERWLTTLQQDLKDFLHVVCDDQDLDEDLRAMAVSAVLYTLAPGDVIPDSSGVPGYIDDALALRVILDRVRERAPSRFEGYLDRIPELTASVGDDLDAFRAWLGDDLYELFSTRVGAVEKNEFKGKHARDLLSDPDGATWLEDEVSVAALKLDFKPQAVASAARRVTSLLPTFKQKLQAMRR